MWSRPRLGGRKLLIFRPKTSNPALSPALAAADISASATWTADSSFVSIDGGRLMTARITQEMKLDTAVPTALALRSAAARAGGKAGFLAFGLKVNSFLPP